METEQVRTFLTVAGHGSFIEAATRLHITQSTVSARIQALEQILGTRLFTRNRSGARLTTAGKRFLPHAKAMLLSLEQAMHDVGLPSRFKATLRIGARIALWDGFLPAWVGAMQQREPDIAIRSDIGFEDDLMSRLVEGTLDLGLMYTPRHHPGLHIEHLFDETLVMVTTRSDGRHPEQDYVYVDWGAAFHAQHRASFPDLERPAQLTNIGLVAINLLLANGGSCFLPRRLATGYCRRGEFFLIDDGPEFKVPAYVVYPLESDNPVRDSALAQLRQLAIELA